MLRYRAGREENMRRVNVFALLFLLSAQHNAQSTWDLGTPIPTARMDAASAVVDDTLYVMGGRQSEAGSERLVDVVEAYVPVTDSWFTDYPTLPLPAALQASAVVGRRIYLLGGLGPESQTLDCIWHWQPGEEVWSDGASLPFPVQGAAATTLQDGTILLIGGLTASGDYMNEVFIVYPGSFGVMEAPELNQARAGAGAVRVGDVVLVTGGYFYGPMGNCELFGGSTWSVGPPLPYPTGSHISCVSGIWTFVVGGQGQSGPLAEVLLLRGLHGVWDSSGESMSIPRARLAGGKLGGFLVAAGGKGSDGSMALDSVERIELDAVGRSPLEDPVPGDPVLRLAVWPNPVITHFTVAADLTAREQWEMALHNPRGERVWSASGVSQAIRIGSCPIRNVQSGIYFLSLRTKSQTSSTPLTILE
jgi:hypothetical protein